MQETTAPPPQQASPWILNPASDLGFFIATPLLILPLTLALLEGVESSEIQYLILAFGAMGHNLPGMLRAYGDRELFRRLRVGGLNPNFQRFGTNPRCPSRCPPLQETAWQPT